ncbi:MAG: diguanylate cyclase [bacterium]|nr:diguanylate cyclase [bacterium]
MSQGKILVVDDDHFFRQLYSEILISEGYEVEPATSGAEAVEYVKLNAVDLVITDLMMPDMNGQEVLERTKQYNALTDVILITGHGTIESAIAALKSGAFDYLRKPVNKDELLLSVGRCLEQKRMLEENQGLKRSLKLLEVSRTISSCLDREKLYEHSLDALLQEIATEAGILLFREKTRSDESFYVKAARQTPPDIAAKIASLFNIWVSDRGDIKENVALYGIDDFISGEGKFIEGVKSVLLVPVKVKGDVDGFVLTFNRLPVDSYSSLDIENSKFIAEQTTLAFENVEKYLNAQEMAYVDSLTDLYNTRYLDIALGNEINRSMRSREPFTVLFMDLDHFKDINDVHGHLVGSKLLIEVGAILLECVRDIDTVVRYGGDEYTIILVGTGHDTAYKVAERIRATIEGNAFLSNEGLKLNLTASIGLATYPSHAKDKKGLLDMADRAMYYGKNRSRNTVYIASLSPASDDEA